MHAHIHPTRVWFTARLAIGSVNHNLGLKVPYGATRMAITVPRAPSPRWGVTPRRIAYAATETGVTRPFTLLRTHAPDLNPLTPYALWLGP